jgi:hypothetical protein
MNKNGYYYMCHPYSVFSVDESGNENRKELERQFQLANKAAGWLMDPKQGFSIISPISHCHPIAEIHDLPRTWEYWKKIDQTYIEASIGIIVVMNDGWGQSEGVTSEIELARQLGKPIYWLIPVHDKRYELVSSYRDYTQEYSPDEDIQKEWYE